ncbi:MAG TPA: TIGR03960 family B12-binding radical SAM protein [Candidatus Omnitrophota bacterium]|nr:TIGR03960 family B12-binding radical SAM protein [Candidatus Omnitrophota bacterium]HPT06859.1 TIGR03960 family B12-binding radical SAM protein [Candidatus Omnitrophota bacterium]
MNIDELLVGIQKPGRYIGREWNVSRKKFEDADVRFALCFPDLYEIGMSNLGVRILYGIMNALSGVACERFFAVAADLETRLKEKGELLFSLESRKALKDFDLVGFSLGHEMQFTNCLAMLESGGIPLRSQERDERFPFIIGGGPCVANPEPMHAFFDFFVIGEAEEAIVEIIEVYRAHRGRFQNKEITRRQFLETFASIQGVYVPSLYDVTYTATNQILDFKPNSNAAPCRIKKRVVSDFEKAPFPAQWLVPYIQIIHDRITLELTRGCPNTCRFCQARHHYYPYRIRKPETMVALAQQAYQCSGYDELALGGLSVSDYPFLQELLVSLLTLFKDKGVSVSLPSIKPKTMLGNLTALIASVKKTGLTFAPEAGSMRMRAVLGKQFNDAEFFQALEESYRSGYQHVKLYFLMGVPLETDADLDGIVDFSVAVSQAGKKACNRPAQVNVSVNALIPKPHTPFQWFGMDARDTIERKQIYIRKKLCSNKRLKISFHNLEMSFLEGVFSRGDRRLAGVVERAYKKGARFDAWDEIRKFVFWQEAFAEEGVNPAAYLGPRSLNELLPWDFLDMGLSKESMRQEYEKVVASK